MMRCDASIHRKEENAMQHRNRVVVGLAAVVTMVVSLALVGCPGDDENPATAADLDGKAFTFADGGAIHPDLAGQETTVTFTGGQADLVSIQSGGNEATGTNTFGSCTFEIGPTTDPRPNPPGGSNFPDGDGPQPNDVLIFPTCDFDASTGRLTLVNENGVGAISEPGIETGTGGGGS
jgi:hypothetical protein